MTTRIFTQTRAKASRPRAPRPLCAGVTVRSAPALSFLPSRARLPAPEVSSATIRSVTGRTNQNWSSPAQSRSVGTHHRRLPPSTCPPCQRWIPPALSTAQVLLLPAPLEPSHRPIARQRHLSSRLSSPPLKTTTPSRPYSRREVLGRHRPRSRRRTIHPRLPPLPRSAPANPTPVWPTPPTAPRHWLVAPPRLARSR